MNSVRLRFQVIEVGWESDLDDNHHPRIRIGRRNWSAALYDHPAEGWQVISLEIVLKTNRDTRIQEHDGNAAESKFHELIGGEMIFANSVLDTIADELYENGCKGAAKRWIGKVITLPCERQSNEEVK